MRLGISINDETIAFKNIVSIRECSKGEGFYVYLKDNRVIHFLERDIYNQIKGWLLTGHPILPPGNLHGPNCFEAKEE